MGRTNEEMEGNNRLMISPACSLWYALEGNEKQHYDL